MNEIGGPKELLAEWQSDADALRRWGDDLLAEAVERCIQGVSDWWRERQLELLSVEEALAFSAYTESGLQKLRERGELSDITDDRGRRRYVLGELPRKPRRAGSTDGSDGPDLAEEILELRRG